MKRCRLYLVSVNYAVAPLYNTSVFNELSYFSSNFHTPKVRATDTKLIDICCKSSLASHTPYLNTWMIF